MKETQNGEKTKLCGPNPLFSKESNEKLATISFTKSNFLLKPGQTSSDLESNETASGTLGKPSSPTRKVVTMNNINVKPEIVRPNVDPTKRISSSSVIKPVMYPSKSRANIFKWFRHKTDHLITKTECSDMNHRLQKMSWGKNLSSSSPSGGQKGNARTIIFKCVLFGIKAVVASSLCYYSATEGLWGTQEETQIFYSNLIKLTTNSGNIPTQETVYSFLKDFKDKSQA